MLENKECDKELGHGFFWLFGFRAVYDVRGCAIEVKPQINLRLSFVKSFFRAAGTNGSRYQYLTVH